MPNQLSRRAAIRLIGGGLLFTRHVLAQGTKGDPLNAAYPFTEIDHRDWPKLSWDEANILSVKLWEDEAKALIIYKMDHHILANKDTISNLKQKHGLDISSLDLMFARHVVIPKFADNVIKEFKSNDPWNNGTAQPEMTVESVMDKFWKRLSVHAQVDEIQLECKERRGLSHKLLTKEVDSYVKVLGQREQWRGHVPFDPMTLDIGNDKAVENIARRRPQLDFPKIFAQLEIPLGILKVTLDDLNAIGIKNNDPRITAITRQAATPRP